MPINEPFWNPYRFVPTREQVNRQSPVTGEKILAGTFSGEVVCTLANLSPLFIGTNSQTSSRPFIVSRRNNKPFIPGSSLKGMFRSLAEVVGGGCSVISTRGTTPTYLQACSDNLRLCIACRMFGMMGQGAGCKVLKGKVSIGDALLVNGEGRTKGMDVYLGGPKLTHTAFYQSANGTVDGKIRKFYFHQPARREQLLVPTGKAAEKKWQIQALPPSPDNLFRFSVQFQNLTSEEYSLLLYIISLEEHVEVSIPQEKGGALVLKGPMLHKVGFAKPLGGGSCRISVVSLSLLPQPAERFRSLNSSRTEFTGDKLAAEILAHTVSFRNEASATMQKLRAMMVWDESDSREFHYPEYFWFKAAPPDSNSQTPLKPI